MQSAVPPDRRQLPGMVTAWSMAVATSSLALVCVYFTVWAIALMSSNWPD